MRPSTRRPAAARSPRPDSTRRRGGATPGPSRAEARPDQGELLELQRSAGNQAVTTLVVQRRTDVDLAELAAGGNDLAAAMVRDWGSVPEALRFRVIDNMLDYTWVAPSDEARLERIWSSFGRERIEALLREPRQWKRWQDCVDRGAELYDIPPMSGYRSAFERDVRKVTNDFLNQNRDFVEQEQVALGLRAPKPGERAPTEEEQHARVVEIQHLIEQIEEMKWLRQQLLKIPVGVDTPGEHRMEDEYDVISGRVKGSERLFDPLNPPSHPTMAWGEGFPPPAHGRTYGEVKAAWDALDQATVMLGDVSPVSFGALTQDRLGDVSADRDAASARAAMGAITGGIHGNIVETIKKLATDDLDWRELQVIHAILYRGDTSHGTLDWSHPLRQAIAKDVVQDYQDAEWWLQLGLGVLTAAAFVFSSLATGGLAAAAWAAAGVGLGAAQAGMSWERYDDLKTAAGSTSRSDLEIVSKEQVDRARFQAILDTAFALVDVLQVARPIGRISHALATRGVRLAGREAAEQGLRNVRELGQAEARAAVERSIREVGVEGTLRATRTTPDELRALVGPSTLLDDALEQTARLGVDLEPAALRRQVSALGEEISAGRLARVDADRIVATHLDLYGPAETLRAAGGWEQLAKALGNESAAGQRLVAWRDSVFDDLRQFIDPNAEGLVQRTGRHGQFTNDLDFSMMGPDAVGNAQKARQFLAGRIRGAADEIDRLLDAGIMTDPRRMHLYDLIDDDAIRQRLAQEAAAMNDELMWAKRLRDAHGNELMEQSIRRQMQEIGVREVPWRPLTEGERAQLAAVLDVLHRQFDAAKRLGNSSEVERLAGEIVKRQALWNASTPGAYSTGGAVRRWVSEREGIGGFGPGGNVPPAITAQQLTDISNQMFELHHAADLLAKASGSTAIAGQLKKLGKYGSRLAETGRAAFGMLDEGLKRVFADLERRFRALQLGMERGTLARLSEEEILAVRAEAFQALGQLEARSTEFLSLLRQEAGIAKMAGGLEAIEDATRAHLALLRATDELRRRVGTEVAQALARREPAGAGAER